MMSPRRVKNAMFVLLCDSLDVELVSTGLYSRCFVYCVTARECVNHSEHRMFASLLSLHKGLYFCTSSNAWDVCIRPALGNDRTQSSLFRQIRVNFENNEMEPNACRLDDYHKTVLAAGLSTGTVQTKQISKMFIMLSE